METKETSTEIHITAEQASRFLAVLERLDGRIRRENSLKYAFLKGAIYGFGTVIGATVLVALFGGIIAATFGGFFGDTPLVETSRTPTE